MSFDSEFDLVPLGEVATFINGDRSTNYPKGDDYVADGISFISAADLSDGRVQQSSVKRISTAAYERLRSGKIRHKDVLFCLRGSIGKLAYVRKEEDGAIASSLVIVRATEKVDARYLYFILCSQAGQQAAASLNNGSAQPNLSVGELQKVAIPLPPLTVQREIAATLDSFDDRINLLRETNATLEAIAQALFKSWFVDFDPVRAKMESRAPEGMDEATAALFPDSFEETELGMVPRGWRWGKLSDFATFQNGYAFKSKDWTDTGHPVIKIGDVKPGIIDLASCSYVSQQTVVGLERFMLKRGDLLVGMTGYVGESGLVPATEPAAYLNQRVGRIATKLGCSDLGYVYCIARSAAFKDFAEAQSHGSAQANVSGTSLMAYSAVLAPLTLIEVFNSAIAGMLEAILSNHEQAQTLSTLRDTLLPRLISGKSRLSTATLEETF